MKTKSTPHQIKAKLGLHGVSDVETAKALMAAYNVRILTIIHPGILMIIHPPLGCVFSVSKRF